MLRRGRGRAPGAVEEGADRTVVAAARRDPLAFERLYRKYVAQVYNFALYELRDTHAAEDVTAQVFLRALAGLPAFREQSPEGEASSFRVWLFQIARNAISNERRRARRHPASPLELALEQPASDDVAATAAARAELARAWQAIDELPADRRRALVLRFVNELSTREIGAMLGRSEAATRVLIHRSLRAVAHRLEAGAGASRRRRAVH